MRFYINIIDEESHIPFPRVRQIIAKQSNSLQDHLNTALEHVVHKLIMSQERSYYIPQVADAIGGFGMM